MKTFVGLISVLLLFALLLTACTSGPTSPTASGSTQATQVVAGTVTIPQAADGEIPVTLHVRDFCPPHGPLTSGANGGNDAFPLTLTFTGPRTFTTQASTGDYVEAIEAGHWKVRSVTTPATTGQSGYRPTEAEFDVPQQTDVTILQFRECGGVPPPPPIPPPCTMDCQPPPPPSCTAQPFVDEPFWVSTDRSRPISASVLVHNGAAFKVAIVAAPSGVLGVQNEKSSSIATGSCGTATLMTTSYDWTHHPWDQWRIVVWMNGVIVKVSPPLFSTLPEGQ